MIINSISKRLEIVCIIKPAIRHKMMKTIPKESFLNLITNSKKNAKAMIMIKENRLILNQQFKS
jgi:hypothetical protein